MSGKRLIFMGTPGFAVPTLQALIDSEHEVVAVYSQPPRPAGRGHKLKNSPVHQLAESHNIPVHTPASLRTPQAQQVFAAYEADFAVVAAYGLLLSKVILDTPKHGCINVHPSDLPRWRGAAPLQHTIIAGDTRTAMCIMQMDEGLDTGDVLWRQPYEIASNTNVGALHDAMAALGAEGIVHVINQYDTLTPTPQSGEACYASKITPQNCWLDTSQPAHNVYQKILGLSPFPGARYELNGETIKVFNAEHIESAQTHDPLTINCSDAAIRITELQRPGKSRMSAEDFLRGYKQ